MARTEHTRRGVATTSLNHREQVFVAEYLKDFNATRAAKAAGYKSPQIQGSQIVKRPLIAKAIDEGRKETLVHLKLTKEAILTQLYYLATRDAGDFIDSHGEIITDVRRLGDHARSAIDGIEQTIVYRKNPSTGRKEKHVTTKLRLCSKVEAINMAMKHKGLFAPEKHEVTMKKPIDWDSLYDADNETVPDQVEAKIIEIQALAKRIDPPHESNGKEQ